MIRSIHIRNFKSLADAKVDLAPFTVLVGNNGSGKSSFLQAIELLSWTVQHEGIDEAIQLNNLDYRDLVYLRAPNTRIGFTVQLAITLPGPAPTESVTIEMEIAKKRYVHIRTENIFRTGHTPASSPYSVSSHKRTRSAREQPGGTLKHENVSLRHSMLQDVLGQYQSQERFPTLSRVAALFSRYVHYEIWGPEALRQASPVTGMSRLGKRGGNLPRLLNWIRNKSDSFPLLQEELKSSFPKISSIGFRFTTLPFGDRGISLAFLETNPGSKPITYSPYQMSDGFMRLLALLAIKYQPNPLPIIGYEEPENGLHPQALIDCVKHLRGIAKRGTQVIVTTHSPYLLNHLLEDDEEPRAELRLVTMDANHRTQIRPPDPTKIDKARKQGFGVGELWGMLLDERELL